MSSHEAKIHINGHRLTEGQSMTVRVAITSFLTKLREPDALGDDEQGKAMAYAYAQNAERILRMLVGPEHTVAEIRDDA